MINPMAWVFGLFAVPPIEYCGSLHRGEQAVLGLGDAAFAWVR